MFAFLKVWGHWACLVYLWINVVIFIVIGSIAFHLGKDHTNMTLNSSPVNL